jgi:hypothetical protein
MHLWMLRWPEMVSGPGAARAIVRGRRRDRIRGSGGDECRDNERMTAHTASFNRFSKS